MYDSSKEIIKIFACRHTFHIRCLRRHYEQARNLDLDALFQKKGEKLRCPTCNIKNYEIENEKNPVAKKKQEEDEEYERKMQLRSSRLSIREQSNRHKLVQKLQQKMDHWDNTLGERDGFLTISDFKFIR